MKRPDTDDLDLSRWPSVDVNALDEKARQGYQQRAMAVEHYATGISIDRWNSNSQGRQHRCRSAAAGRALFRDIE